MRSIPDPRDRGTKRERTRNQLLVATQELLLERPAGSLTIRDVAHQAGLSNGTFYNYFDSIGALLDNLALLFTVTHAQHVAPLVEGVGDPAEIFARTTRQTLRFMVGPTTYGRYLFDVGLPLDHFLGGLHARLAGDVHEGARSGAFRAPDDEITISLVVGSLLGLALDVHRGRLPASSIDEATARMLRLLGVRPQKARRLATATLDPVPPPPLPLTWPRSVGGA